MKGRAVRRPARRISTSDGSSTSIREAVVALKRERIVTAAVDLFYERGYESTTLDAVAERLGITKPFIYSYFKSKTDLLAEICSRGIASSLAAIKAVLATQRSPTEKLHALGREFVLAVLGSQKHIAIFSREEKNLEQQDLARIEQMRREFDRRLVGLLEQGAAAGEFEIEDARIAALAIGGMVSWAYVWYRPAGRLTLSEVAEELTRLIVALVRCRPAATAGARRQVAPGLTQSAGKNTAKLGRAHQQEGRRP
jgi:AcrR family transcriptional regulator